MKIPVEAAEKIAKEYGLAEVMIVGWEENLVDMRGTVQIATYGRSKQHCDWVARLKEKFVKFLGLQKLHEN